MAFEFSEVLGPLCIILAGRFGCDSTGDRIAGSHIVWKIYFDHALRCREGRDVKSVGRPGINTIPRGILRRRARFERSFRDRDEGDCNQGRAGNAGEQG